jgi:hypothetical protein
VNIGVKMYRKEEETANYHQMYLTTLNIKNEFFKLKNKTEQVRLMIINKKINMSKIHSNIKKINENDNKRIVRQSLEDKRCV